MSNDKNIIFVTGYGYKIIREYTLLTKLGEAIAKQFPHPRLLSFDDDESIRRLLLSLLGDTMSGMKTRTRGLHFSLMCFSTPLFPQQRLL